jgi:hypothetical protein
MVQILLVLASLAAVHHPGLMVAVTESYRAGYDSDGDESALIGDWKGESQVVAQNTAAKDEVVVWHITKGREQGTLTVRADKIVNSRTINMGTLPFKIDKVRKGIFCQYGQGVWCLAVKGKTMEGSLTRPDQTVLRRIKLERSE